MFLIDLIDYIEANTSLTAGINLWPHYFPKEENLGVTVAYAGGSESESNMQRFLCQLTSTAIDGGTAESQLTEVYNLLAYNNGLTLASGYIFNIVPLSMVKFVTINKHNYPVFTASIVVIQARN